MGGRYVHAICCVCGKKTFRNGLRDHFRNVHLMHHIEINHNSTVESPVPRAFRWGGNTKTFSRVWFSEFL